MSQKPPPPSGRRRNSTANAVPRRERNPGKARRTSARRPPRIPPPADSPKCEPCLSTSGDTPRRCRGHGEDACNRSCRTQAGPNAGRSGGHCIAFATRGVAQAPGRRSGIPSPARHAGTEHRISHHRGHSPRRASEHGWGARPPVKGGPEKPPENGKRPARYRRPDAVPGPPTALVTCEVGSRACGMVYPLSLVRCSHCQVAA